jgi:hypothetical protein
MCAVGDSLSHAAAGDRYAAPYAHFHPNSDQGARPDCHSDSERNTALYAYRHSDSDQDAHPDCHPNSRAHCHPDHCTQPHPYARADAY